MCIVKIFSNHGFLKSLVHLAMIVILVAAMIVVTLLIALVAIALEVAAMDMVVALTVVMVAAAAVATAIVAAVMAVEATVAVARAMVVVEDMVNILKVVALPMELVFKTLIGIYLLCPNLKRISTLNTLMSPTVLNKKLQLFVPKLI